MQPRKAIYVELNNEVRLRYHCCRGKEIGISYSKCMFVALVIQNEESMRSMILSNVACRDLPYLSTIFYFRKNVFKYKESVLIFVIAFV
jgi:hypothetical protein